MHPSAVKYMNKQLVSWYEECCLSWCDVAAGREHSLEFQLHGEVPTSLPNHWRQLWAGWTSGGMHNSIWTQSVSLRVGPCFSLFNNMQELKSKTKENRAFSTLDYRRLWHCDSASSEHVDHQRLSRKRHLSYFWKMWQTIASLACKLFRPIKH